MPGAEFELIESRTPDVFCDLIRFASWGHLRVTSATRKQTGWEPSYWVDVEKRRKAEDPKPIETRKHLSLDLLEAARQYSLEHDRELSRCGGELGDILMFGRNVESISDQAWRMTIGTV